MASKVDFFTPECQTLNVTAKSFGICDPQDGGKAYVDYNNDNQWIAIVKNESGKPLNFTAIDNCVEIRRGDGNMENRCDAMLTGAGYIIFIELKDQRRDWVDHAVNDQLQTTIDYFKRNCDISVYGKRIAYACNRRQPRFMHSHISLMDEFWRKNNVRLNIVNEIVIK
jgi:hypothetical protein